MNYETTYLNPKFIKVIKLVASKQGAAMTGKLINPKPSSYSTHNYKLSLHVCAPCRRIDRCGNLAERFFIMEPPAARNVLRLDCDHATSDLRLYYDHTKVVN